MHAIPAVHACHARYLLHAHHSVHANFTTVTGVEDTTLLHIRFVKYAWEVCLRQFVEILERQPLHGPASPWPSKFNICIQNRVGPLIVAYILIFNLICKNLAITLHWSFSITFHLQCCEILNHKLDHKFWKSMCSQLIHFHTEVKACKIWD